MNVQDDSGAAKSVHLDVDERLRWLRGIQPFLTLAPGLLVRVAKALEEVHYPTGATVFDEGDEGDRLFIVVAGDGELSVQSTAGRAPLATVGPGDITGELALMSPSALRSACLTAATPLVLLSLDRSTFHSVLATNPRTKAAFERHAELLRRAGFIKRVGPFMRMDDDSRRWLAGRLRGRVVPAGEELIREGEPGESCYLLRSGHVDVVVAADGGGERRLCSLAPGALIGETALLAESARTATVRATDDAEVLELKRADLESILERDEGVAHEVVQVFRLRDRPRRAAGVLVTERPTPEGETLTILKHPEHLTYFRLSERGRFIWELLDGDHDLRALTLEYLKRFGQLSPDTVARIVSGLVKTKMAEARALRPGVLAGGAPARKSQLLSAARRLVEKDVSLKDVDARVEAIYRRGVHLLFTRPALAVLTLIALAGAVAFIVVAPSVDRGLDQSGRAALLMTIPGLFLSIFLHEAAHAFAVKAFGRTVNRAGIGWYWFAPMAFVDTSDMWLGTRRQRIAVSLAGPFTDALVAGSASLAALATANDVVSALLWSFALPSYIAVFTNLNPLLEYDGYHVLSDLLNRPNLRAEALGWLGSRLPQALGDRRELARHWVDLLYGIGAVLYIAAMAVAVVLLYRLVVQDWIASVLPSEFAAGLAWFLALSVSLLATLALAADLRLGRRSQT